MLGRSCVNRLQKWLMEGHCTLVHDCCSARVVRCVKYSVTCQLPFKKLLVIKPWQHGKWSRKQGKIALWVQEDQEELWGCRDVLTLPPKKKFGTKIKAAVESVYSAALLSLVLFLLLSWNLDRSAAIPDSWWLGCDELWLTFNAGTELKKTSSMLRVRMGRLQFLLPKASRMWWKK